MNLIKLIMICKSNKHMYLKNHLSSYFYVDCIRFYQNASITCITMICVHILFNMIIRDTTYILVLSPVVKDMSEMYTQKTSYTMSHTLIGITPCRIQKFLIYSILSSTCMRTKWSPPGAFNFLLRFLVRNGGQYNLTPCCDKSSLICINHLSTITASHSSSRSNNISLVI